VRNSVAPAKLATGRGTPWLRVSVVVVAIVLISLTGLFIIPANSVSKQVQFAPGSSATANISVPRPAWVSVHFDKVGGYGGMMGGSGMVYWMQGPSGMMFNHSMMRSGDSYSFWTWGGTFHCGAGYAGTGSNTISVWVNASWGVL
jgi:hypothetical protein